MPNFFCLMRKSDGPDAKPVPLVIIDEEMCAYFEVRPHPEFYYCSWYQTIGFALSCGHTFDWMRDRINESTQSDDDKRHSLAIVNWLDLNFIPDAWAQIGK